MSAVQKDDLTTFRQETRQWLEANCPQSMRTPVDGMTGHVWGARKIEFASPDQKLWFERMRDKKWFCPNWPVEYGGGGLSKAEHEILKQEMRRLNCRPPQANLGVWMIGPVILEFGTEAQKQKFLPPIARGEIRWCQGFSEPGAGSDLASLKTRAVRVGDEFVLNGSKMWTSYGDKSDWMFALVRSNPDVPKRNGISFVLFDMLSKGVSTKTITLTNGDNSFCQTFLDDVHVPIDQVIGQIDAGWTVAKRLLEHERSMMSEMEETSARPDDFPDVLAKQYLEVTENGKLADPVMRDRIAQHLINKHAFDLTMQRVVEEFAVKDPMAGMAGVIAKYYGTEETKRKYQLLLDILGAKGLSCVFDEEHVGFSDEEVRITKQYFSTYTYTVAGGTSEIQLDIIANQVLGLPR